MQGAHAALQQASLPGCTEAAVGVVHVGQGVRPHQGVVLAIQRERRMQCLPVRREPIENQRQAVGKAAQAMDLGGRMRQDDCDSQVAGLACERHAGFQDAAPVGLLRRNDGVTELLLFLALCARHEVEEARRVFEVGSAWTAFKRR